MISCKNIRGGRDSNLELYRIVTMLLIIAHHFVVNSEYAATPLLYIEDFAHSELSRPRMMYK